MSSICVAGGTGRVGREVVQLALAAGHQVSVISRHVPPVGSDNHYDGATYYSGDVTTGVGLAAALGGVDVVIDCLEGQFGKAQKQFADGGARLLRAAHAGGVRRAVALSIINCDLSDFAYYASKADKEARYLGAPLETVVVRATQFHSLVAGIFAAGARIGLIPVFKGVRFQTIAPADVAAVLLEEALAVQLPSRHHARTVGGPEVVPMRAMAEAWKAVTGARGMIVSVPLPGSMGAFLRSGHNLSPADAVGTETFVSWLEKRRESL